MLQYTMTLRDKIPHVAVTALFTFFQREEENPPDVPLRLSWQVVFSHAHSCIFLLFF